MQAPTWFGPNGSYREVMFRRLMTPLNRPVRRGEIVTAYTDGQVTLRSNRSKIGYHEATDLSTYQGVEAGDLVVHGLDILRGSVGVSDSVGAISPVCIVCRPSLDVDARFVAYAMRAQAWSGFPKAMARGIREGGADFRRWETLGELPLPCPPFEEQRRIADFLDVETARINRLLGLSARAANLEAERVEAQIESVVQGVLTRPGVQAISVGYLTRLITSGPRGWGEYVTDQGVPFFRSANLDRESLHPKLFDLARVSPPSAALAEAARTRIREGDVLIGITGANSGWVSLVHEQELEGGHVSQHVCLVRPDDNRMNSAWLAHCMRSRTSFEALSASQYGGTKTQLSLGDIKRLVVPVPDLDTQQGLVRTLDRLLGNARALRLARQRREELLRERRAGLVAAAVTGHLDVTTDRGAA
jgi:type I restriction enzyme S subunit